MKTTLKRTALAAFFAVAATSATFAQESRVSFDAGANLVSSYILRGISMTGASVQPSMSLSASGFSVGALGSASVVGDHHELDLFVSYKIGGFSIAVVDYWWNGGGYNLDGTPKTYFGNRDGHWYEVCLNYTVSESFPLSFGVNTMFAGKEDRKLNDDGDLVQRYSTYITASYLFSVGDVDLSLGVAVTPWEGVYHVAGKTGFEVATVTLQASKKLKVTESYSLPIFMQVIAAPSQDNAHFVFGIKF